MFQSLYWIQLSKTDFSSTFYSAGICIFLDINNLLLAFWSSVKCFCVFFKFLVLSDKVYDFSLKFCVMGFIYIFLVRHYFYRTSRFAVRYIFLAILVLVLQFDLVLWTSFFGYVSDMIIWLSLCWACAGAAWPEVGKVKVMDKLFNCIRQRWFTNRGFRARSVGSEMAVSRKRMEEERSIRPARGGSWTNQVQRQ